MTDGFINLCKPLSWTSHDCVARVRKLLNTKKVGHGGTLDPLATGVLPLAVGRATRLLQYLPAGKAYRATVRFGLVTTTDDLEGEISSQQSAAHLSRPAVEAVLGQFVGAQDQIPPMYSAVQVDGKRLYDLARKGKAVDVPVRRVTIDRLAVQGWRAGEHPELVVDVACSPGTYIRSLARDLGAAMGTGATLAALVRTHSSGFELADSLSLEDLEQALAQGHFEPVAAGKAMGYLEAIALPPDLSRRWRLGQKLSLSDVANALPAQQLPPQAPLGHPLRVIEGSTQSFLGIGEFRTSKTHQEGSVVFASKRVYSPLG